jgi:hypothetical protein
MKQALKFCGDIGDLDGPYPYVNETQIVSDSRKVLTALRQAIAEAEKREWVGLHEHELQVLEYNDPSGERLKLAKAVEAKLKEKNT